MTISYCTEHEWEQAIKNIERKQFESLADLIGLVSKYRYLVKNSTGMQQEIYKKELNKVHHKLTQRQL